MISYEEYELVERIKNLIEKKEWKKIIKKLTSLPPSDIAYILENSNKETKLLLFRLLPKKMQPGFFLNLK